MKSSADISLSQGIQRRHGKSYYFATAFFPRELREATYVLYAFCRVPDEIVDTECAGDLPRARGRLHAWKQSWSLAHETGLSDDPVLRAAAVVFHQYHIPYEYSVAFLDAMIQDTEKSRYENYAALESYMYGSAAVVGLMMSEIIGYRRADQARVRAYASALGYAMQLTNFLRDIGEDYDTRGRIYLPQDEMARFGVTEDDIRHHRVTESFRAYMKDMIARTRQLYHEADEGIPLLDRRGRWAVRVARVLYSAILDEIEQQDYDIYRRRARVSFVKKVWLLGRAVSLSL